MSVRRHSTGYHPTLALGREDRPSLASLPGSTELAQVQSMHPCTGSIDYPVFSGTCCATVVLADAVDGIE